METTREARNDSLRENNERIDEDFYTFEEPDALEIPQSVKDRYAAQDLVLRWIRTEIRGKDDLSNVRKRLQDGWDWVLPEDVPEMMGTSVVRENGQYSGTVSRGDLSLAYASRGRMEARQRFYENKSREMMQAVESQLGNVNAQARNEKERIRNSSKTQVAVGRHPSFQKD